MAKNLQSAEPLLCPYCRRVLRRVHAGTLDAAFECDDCGAFPDRGPTARAAARNVPLTRTDGDRRSRPTTERRAVPRGGRRPTDGPGRYPPVLVADSDEGARRVFARYLDRFMFEVHEAATGEAALDVVEALSPRVVIAELTLPRDDAFQARVRERGVPYIVTVTNNEGVVPADAVAVLEKPFSLTELLAEVRRALSQQPPVAA